MEDDSAQVQTPVEAAARRHALTTLRHRSNRLLWFGQLFGWTGMMMQEVTVGWQVYLLTDSPLQVGLLGLSRFISVLAFSQVGGAVADLADRRRVLTGTQLTLAVLALTLAATSSLGAVTTWLLYAVTSLTWATLSFDQPARQALLPNTVPRDELGSALTLQSLLRQTATVVGSGVGGLVIAHLGVGSSYALAGACYLGMVVTVQLMGRVKETRGPSERGWATVLGGLRYARQEPVVLLTYALDLAVTTCVQTLTLIPIFAKDVLAVGAQGLGLLHAASAVGAMVGGAVLGVLGGVARPIPVMLAAYAARGVCVLGFGQAPAFSLALLALFCGGIADVVSEVTSQTVVQLKTPDAVRGRVMAFGMLFTWNGPQLGQLQSGVVASLLGPRTAALVGGVGGMLVPLAFSRFEAMRRGMSEIKGR